MARLRPISSLPLAALVALIGCGRAGHASNVVGAAGSGGLSDASVEGSADTGTTDASRNDTGVPDAAADGTVPATARVNYSTGGFFDAPFPDERLRRSDGTIDLGSFPGAGVAFIGDLEQVLAGASGFGRTTGAFFALTGAIDASTLPDLAGSTSAAATVFVMDVDATSNAIGTRAPASVAFELDGGPFGAPDLLSIVPLQGRPLAANRLYAAVVTRGVRTLSGAPIDVAPATAQIIAGQQPAGLSDAAYAAHRQAIVALEAAGVTASNIAATAVFRTGDPADGLARARTQVLGAAIPSPSSPFSADETFPDYCVFHSTIALPVYQGGNPPYAAAADGGAWTYDGKGALVEQTRATSNIVVTIPRRAMPSNGFPAVVFVRTDAGGNRPLVDRGAQAYTGGPSITAGTGPALEMARAGYAGVSVDGPLGGLRNTASWNEAFTVLNFANPAALRDNIRQGALESVILAQVLRTLTIDASSCSGFGGAARFASDPLTIMGHSTGATVAAVAAAVEPAYRALITSGAGASYSEMGVYRKHPVALGPLLEIEFGYASVQRKLTEHDIALNLFQWALEPADPQVYAERIALPATPRNVLVLQAYLDEFSPPPYADSLALSLGLDLAGPELDSAYTEYPALSALLGYAGAARVALPVSGNRGQGAATLALTQNPGDGIEDPHEAVFQTDAPKRQYRCFLQSLSPTTAPRVPSGTGDASTCD